MRLNTLTPITCLAILAIPSVDHNPIMFILAHIARFAVEYAQTGSRATTHHSELVSASSATLT